MVITIRSKYELFEHIVLSLKEQSNLEGTVYDVGLDISRFTDGLHRIVTQLIAAHYGSAGEETFSWWCYDKEWGTRQDIDMTDLDGNVLCDTLEELHAYLEENKTDDYVIEPSMTDEERLEMLKAMFK